MLTALGVSVSTAGSIVGVIFSVLISFAVLIADCVKDDDGATRVSNAESLADPEYNHFLSVEENQIAYLEKELVKARKEIEEISSLLN